MFARRGHKPSRKPPYQGHNRVADTRDNISNRDGALGIAFLALAKMVTVNHLREGGKARAGQEIKGRVRIRCAW